MPTIIGDDKTRLRASYRKLATGEVGVLLSIVEIDSEELLCPFKDKTDYPSHEDFKFREDDGDCDYIACSFPTLEEAQAWVGVQVASLKKHLDAWRSVKVPQDEEFEI